MKTRTTALISALFCFTSITFAQSKQEVKELIPPKSEKTKYHSDAIDKNGSSVEGALFLYKNFISSQDASRCSFSPSCSEYAVLAVKKQGFIKGLINFADRFQRCNGESPEQYEYIKEEHLLYDPVRDIKFREL